MARLRTFWRSLVTLWDRFLDWLMLPRDVAFFQGDQVRRPSFRQWLYWSLLALCRWLVTLWDQFFEWLLTPGVIAFLLGGLGVSIAFGGYLYWYCAWQYCPNLVAGWDQLFRDFYANAATTLLGIAITVFTINRASERRAERQLKEQLIREMCSADRGFALQALERFRAHRWLEGGELQGAYLLGINLPGANLQDANLQGAVLVGAKLQGAKLQGAKLQGADLTWAALQQAELEGVDLQEANLYQANLRGANLRGANLAEGTILQEANLEGADLQGADLENAFLKEAILREANLEGAKLQGAILQEAVLVGANLQEANLQEAKLQGATLSRANLEGAKLQGARGLTDQQLIKVSILRLATMFDGSAYDGCFNLLGDIEFAQSIHVNPKDPEAMAHYYYGISLEAYLVGQEWARENLPRLRREAGLEPEETAKTGEAPQLEKPPTTAPNSNMPRPKRTITGGASRWQHTVPRHTTTGSTSKRSSK